MDDNISLTLQNKKLTHTISRLKQSSDQYKRIIIEKDQELFQLARHASLAEMTAGITHEMSQPLTGIKGVAQNLIDDINYEEFNNLHAVADLTKISNLVDKSATIIDHIRSFSKKGVFQKKALSINETIRDAIDLIGSQLRKNDIELFLHLEESLPQFYGDKISIEQLVINILLNARDAINEKIYNDDDQGIITIKTLQNNDTYISLIIEDNGIGIQKDSIKKIWSPFFTTKSSNLGTGIGLSISSKILKEHEATIDVSSGNGLTVFTFNFPV